MPRRHLSLFLLAATACTADGPAEIAWCDGDVHQIYDPLFDTRLGTFPDDLWTVEDATSPTGRRVDVSDAPWIEEMPVGMIDLASGLSVASGFARLGAVVQRFDGALGDVPADAAASLVDEGILLVELGPEPRRVPFRASLGETGKQLEVQPLAVLSPGMPHALVVTTAQRSADGGCIAPSAVTRAMLDGTVDDPRLAEVGARWREALDALGLEPGDVSAMTVFTTHDDLRAFGEAAADAASRTYAWSEAPVCDENGHCTGRFEAHDYRTDGGAVLDGAPVATWELAVDVWLPPERNGPVPVIIYGHGMNGSRRDGAWVRRVAADLGFAVVATDAVKHGDHPTVGGGPSGGVPFLGLDLDSFRIDLLALRGAFQQTPLDRAQLVGLLRDAADIDGDGEDDLDASRIAYWGVSLGGLLAPGLFAATSDVDAGLWQVPGGHLVVFATETEAMGLLQPLLVSLMGDEDGLTRLFAVAQSAVDAGDPAVIATHVLRDRFDDGAAPDVLVQVALHDAIVPPPTGEMLARGLGAPHVPPVVWPVDGLEVKAPATTSPVVGYVQFDVVHEDGVAVEATHGATPGSDEAIAQARAFFEAWRDTGTARIEPVPAP